MARGRQRTPEEARGGQRRSEEVKGGKRRSALGETNTMKMSYVNIIPRRRAASLSDGRRRVRTKMIQTATCASGGSKPRDVSSGAEADVKRVEFDGRPSTERLSWMIQANGARRKMYLPRVTKASRVRRACHVSPRQAG